MGNGSRGQINASVGLQSSTMGGFQSLQQIRKNYFISIIYMKINKHVLQKNFLHETLAVFVGHGGQTSFLLIVCSLEPGQKE